MPGYGNDLVSIGQQAITLAKDQCLFGTKRLSEPMLAYI